MNTPVMNALEAKTLVPRRVMRVLIVAGFAAVAGCVAGGGYDGGVSVGYDVGFYEPFGYDYGGWGPGYGVGLPRRGYDRGRPDFHSAPHPSYRPAAPSRPMPSLPSHSRGR
jgi:hypothetical protein